MKATVAALVGWVSSLSMGALDGDELRTRLRLVNVQRRVLHSGTAHFSNELACADLQKREAQLTAGESAAVVRALGGAQSTGNGMPVPC